MSFIKKNCTIVVLVAIVISALSLNMIAAPTILDQTNVAGVFIQTKKIVGAYPQAEEIILDTYSYTVEHYDCVWIVCTQCGVGVHGISDGVALDPTAARAVAEYPWECWIQDHYLAVYRVCE